MTNRQLYMEKRKEVHTPEEFLAAFEDNTAIVFELAKERNPSDKRNLFARIWEINPKALITEDCDLCALNIEPTAYRKQILVINKDADKDMDKAILSQLYASGVVPSCYVSYREKRNGIKRCILEKMEPTRPIVMKMNLLIDGGNLLITIRHIS